MDNLHFLFDFAYNDEIYVAHVRHYDDLSREERQIYLVQENTFVVHLFSTMGFKTFELFIEAGDMEMRWRTKSVIMVDPAIVEIIGKKIDDKYL